MMKKPHPCGNDVFLIMRTGVEFRLKCLKCGREMFLPREKALKCIKKILPTPGDNDEK